MHYKPGFKTESSPETKQEYNRIFSELLRLERTNTLGTRFLYHAQLINDLIKLDKSDILERATGHYETEGVF